MNPMSHEPQFFTSSYCTSGQCVEIGFETSSYCGTSNCVEVGFRKATASAAGNCVEVAFHKATASGTSGCVEVASCQCNETTVYVRDSKNKTGPVLSFDRDSWTTFLTAITDGQFDL
jgi:hypothetical protein